jgi:hypothetical protein
MPRSNRAHRRNAAGRMVGTVAGLTHTAIAIVDPLGRRWLGPLDSLSGAARVGDVVRFTVDHLATRPRIVWAAAEER